MDDLFNSGNSCEPPTKPQPASQLMIAGTVLFHIVSYGAVLYGVGWLSWMAVPDQYRYSWQYHVDSSNVLAESEPKDCDFIHAPLGDKGCHYEKHVVEVKDDAGRVTGVAVTWAKIKD